ncbi:hypothetical protein [Mesoplasma photuris]|uniref:hypothetical protein n=1 Tax=Mesoplasma photuris TaxID=217731 RepID=UPI0004E28072|nr:hypothetical protein [Mesoplasma photuris]
MKQIEIDEKDYVVWNDYNDLMVQAFGIGCSLCGSSDIFFVLKNHPKPIGNLLKELSNQLSDEEVEKYIQKPLEDWQIFDDKNADQERPTFLCDECFNSIGE